MAAGNECTLFRGVFAFRMTPLGQFPPYADQDLPGALLSFPFGEGIRYEARGPIGNRKLLFPPAGDCEELHLAEPTC